MGVEIGRWMIAAGIVLVVAGLIVVAVGRLPGDLVYRRGGVTVFIPIGTMILISLVLTIVANVIVRFWRR
ncbi:MAG TPA: DUF2905 domain-containing protein [Herpetosiphonaceae bacterium]